MLLGNRSCDREFNHCRRLQTAKEKLHRLQELVAMVQQSSADASQTLPRSIAELASEVGLDDPVDRPVAAAVPRSRSTGSADLSPRPAAVAPQPAVVMGCPFGQRYWLSFTFSFRFHCTDMC